MPLENKQAEELLGVAVEHMRKAALLLSEDGVKARHENRFADASIAASQANAIDSVIEVIASMVRRSVVLGRDPEPLQGFQLDVVSALVNLGTPQAKAKIAVCRAVVALPKQATFDELFKKALTEIR